MQSLSTIEEASFHPSPSKVIYSIDRAYYFTPVWFNTLDVDYSHIQLSKTSKLAGLFWTSSKRWIFRHVHMAGVHSQTAIKDDRLNFLKTVACRRTKPHRSSDRMLLLLCPWIPISGNMLSQLVISFVFLMLIVMLRVVWQVLLCNRTPVPVETKPSSKRSSTKPESNPVPG